MSPSTPTQPRAPSDLTSTQPIPILTQNARHRDSPSSSVDSTGGFLASAAASSPIAGHGQVSLPQRTRSSFNGPGSSPSQRLISHVAGGSFSGSYGSGTFSKSPSSHLRTGSHESLLTNAAKTPEKNGSSRKSGWNVKNPRDLLTMVNGVVKNRTGSVLQRQMILKSEHFDIAVNTDLDFYLQGAPNFRMADANVYGVAQPTIIGLSTILTLLNCHPDAEVEGRALWFSAREEPMIYLNGKPFVLREEENPLQNIKRYQGISASRLEQMEARLKEDIMKEAQKTNGLILVHDELDNGRVVPAWIAADVVQTPREVYESFEESGYRVKYVRVPISPEQAPEDGYLDLYVDLIRNTDTNDALVFNCGMGVGRTTFAMIIALLIRRSQLIAEGREDIYRLNSLEGARSGSQGELAYFGEGTSQERAILRLVYVLEKGLNSKMSPNSAIEWALARGQIIDDLKNAILGNYTVIQQLTSVLQDGSYCKRLLDMTIDSCDTMINLREVILMNRVRYSATGEVSFLEKALACLDRYFSMLAFAAYVNESYKDGFKIEFSQWSAARPEIQRMLDNLRRKGPRLYLFRPVEDLSALSDDTRLTALGHSSSFAPHKPLASEMEKYVIKTRLGAVLGPQTILKVDHWSSEILKMGAIDGAPSFRKIYGVAVYGVAQPTIQGLKNVVKYLLGRTDVATQATSIENDSSIPGSSGLSTDIAPGSIRKVCWINLREEPLIYINGLPYVLRDQYFTLRNIKSYSGITSQRLELMEARLKEDAVNELRIYDQKLLLHTETVERDITAVWEDVTPSNVLTLREAMSYVESDGDPLDFYRVPVTAETPPDETDFDTILQIISKQSLADTAIVMNCQVGLGRSTTGTVVASLVIHWLTGTVPPPPRPANHMQNAIKSDTGTAANTPPKRLNYQVTHSLLRVVRNGMECKRIVDDVIDNCGAILNLRDEIEQLRVKAEQSGHDESSRKRYIRRGLTNLKRYFLFIAFQAYLTQTNPGYIDDLESFAHWMQQRPELRTLLQDLDDAGLEALIPVEKLTPGDGIALTNEVLQVVNARDGPVLAQQTILKYDMFPGCQKLTLPEKVEGAPNFRIISLAKIRGMVVRGAQNPLAASFHQFGNEEEEMPSVCGVAMPTKDGIRRVLMRMNAGPTGNRELLWTCLREEPVIYVNGRPYVLRLFQDPLKNLEATGITRERVEMMEVQMKTDILRELKRYQGRLLLHEEEALANGGFSIVPVWETVKDDDVQTPGEMFKAIQEEGYQVDYLRLPITDEQAPIPDVFDDLVDRILNVEDHVDIMFNCQMGRGRTTTGMVITCLMEMIVGNVSLLDTTSSLSETEEETEDEDFNPKSPKPVEETDRKRYTNGDYKLVRELIGALQHGKLAKHLTDQAIDQCHHLQNLRNAIYDYKLRVDSCQPGTRKHDTLYEIGLNYLIRYFYLITFADYLLEETVELKKGSVHQLNQFVEDSGVTKSDSVVEKDYRKFSDWLKDRREITNIIRKSNQSFD